MWEKYAKYELLCRGVKCFLNLNHLNFCYSGFMSYQVDMINSYLQKKTPNLIDAKEGVHKVVYLMFTLIVGMARCMV